MRIELIGFDDEMPAFEATLADVPVRIGRHRDVDIRVTDRWVSRYHCEVRRINGILWVRDLGSKHGVFVNGFHVTSTHLMPGDRLTVGTTSFRVKYERQAPPKESPVRLGTRDCGRGSCAPIANSA